VINETVVVDHGVITSRGPGTALEFALALVAELAGPAVRQRVESALERTIPGRP
jgi:4-methyl-5(b-hydroxyethyl)-thiazole monophosphate biosynthesis